MIRSRLLLRALAVSLMSVLVSATAYPWAAALPARDETSTSTSTNLTLVATPVVQWYTPGKPPLGPTTFIINGLNFVSGAVAKLDGVALPTAFLSSTQLQASSNFAQS